MKRHHALRATIALILLALSPHLHPASAYASSRAQREHLTPEEVEQVRINQALDLRMGVFVKAVERRLAALADPKASEKLSEKELRLWGVVEGTRAQLLADIDHILEEAVTNVEDASIHSEKSSLIPKGLRKLAEGAGRFLPQLTAMGQAAQEDGEREMIARVVETLQEITAAAGKLPPEVKVKK
jgi:hypothetical protein